ncbi:MAG TPA: hypothetical protein PLH98_16575 [Ruminococcus flavefaciens]|nr:hypothetical protein [Ruminococcus flavefaciens]HQM02142.1 hypothetical protein [Ruminococcus flavefaciens]
MIAEEAYVILKITYIQILDFQFADGVFVDVIADVALVACSGTVFDIYTEGMQPIGEPVYKGYFGIAD